MQSEIFRMLKRKVFAFKLVGSATIPQEVEEILGLMTTARLSLKYESLIEGRKVLQWVSFNPGTILNIRQRYDYDHIRLQPDYDQVVPETRDLQIPPSKLASIKHLSFGGDIAPNELATLLHSSIPILSLQCDYELKEYFAIVQEYMRNFLEGRSTQERCIIYACRELLQCVFESIAGDGEHIIVNGSRQVRLVYPQAVLYLLFEQKNQSW
ncbi:hypothetical protein Y032_0017g3264 [Ancylostoma ceylanicum]|nr:hypothetical protein Y032_0017g3264 [Ancylostoma ceylanicum]